METDLHYASLPNVNTFYHFLFLIDIATVKKRWLEGGMALVATIFRIQIIYLCFVYLSPGHSKPN